MHVFILRYCMRFGHTAYSNIPGCVKIPGAMGNSLGYITWGCHLGDAEFPVAAEMVTMSTFQNLTSKLFMPKCLAVPHSLVPSSYAPGSLVRHISHQDGLARARTPPPPDKNVITYAPL